MTTDALFPPGTLIPISWNRNDPRREVLEALHPPALTIGSPRYSTRVWILGLSMPGSSPCHRSGVRPSDPEWKHLASICFRGLRAQAVVPSGSQQVEWGVENQGRGMEHMVKRSSHVFLWLWLPPQRLRGRSRASSLGGHRKALGHWIAALVTLTGFYEAAAGPALPSVLRQGRVNVLGLK